MFDDAAAQSHVAKVMECAAERRVSRFVVTGGNYEKPIDLKSADEMHHYMLSMLREGFCCKSVVQRAWLKTALLVAFWEKGDDEPPLSGSPETDFVWIAQSI